MSNRIVLQPTIFQNHKSEKKTFGYRLYDDFTQFYSNLWIEIPDDDMEILVKVIKERCEEVDEVITSLLENEQGIYIGDVWYDFKDVKDIIEDAYLEENDLLKTELGVPTKDNWKCPDCDKTMIVNLDEAHVKGSPYCPKCEIEMELL